MIMRDFIMPFATGLAIFLFGMQVMRIGFENLFLDKIKKVLFQLTKNSGIGLLTGTLATAICQSSSAVTLLTLGLTHSKVITLRQAISIILGANIGTTLTTELIAYKIDNLALYLFIMGLILFLIPKITIKSTGLVFGGFGLLFMGMEIMQSITPLLQHAGGVDWFYLVGKDGVLSGVVAGTVFTSLIQSSTATTAITMNLIYDQLLPLPIAIAMILGSNIGTCITAILASFGTSVIARQVALAHVLLNIIGVLVFLPLIPWLTNVVQMLSSYPMQQVAHAQAIFNIACSLIVLPFIPYFEKLVIALSPKK